MASIKDIRERAVLVQFKDRIWAASKLDQEVSASVAAQNKAKNSKVGFYKKHLIPRTALKGRLRVSNQTRAYHYRNTLPWMDDGMRILPAKNLASYMRQMREYKKQAEEADKEFFANYNEYVKSAKEVLGKMFRREEYPPLEEVRAKFSFDIVVLPIPEVKDWRVDIGQKEMDALRKEAMGSIMELQQEAVMDLWRRLYEVVNKVQERLEKDDNVFRDSLIENVKKMLEVLPSLNITDDPELTKMAKEIDQKLTKTSPDVLRGDSAARRKTAKEAATITKKMDVFMKRGARK